MLTNVGRLQGGSAPDAELHELPVSKTVGKSLLRSRRQPKSRKDGNNFAGDAKREGVHELERTLQRQVWLASISSLASRPSSSRTESLQLRFNATRSRSTSSWPV